MKIHEYQGKELFRKYGVPVPIGVALAGLLSSRLNVSMLVGESLSAAVICTCKGAPATAVWL